MRPITDEFFKQVAVNPDKLALTCGGESYTYAQLAEAVSKMARALASNGVCKGDHVGVPMLSSCTSVVLLLAACELGVGLVPINPTTPYDAIVRVFRSGDVKHLVAHRAFLKKYLKAGDSPVENVLCIDAEVEGAVYLGTEAFYGKRIEDMGITGEETLVLVMTSGSTGDPKPIDISQNCKRARAKGFTALYNLVESDVVLSATPLYHSLAIRLVLLPLQLGGTAVVLPRFTAKGWLAAIQDNKVTFTIAVSSQITQVSALLEEGSDYDVSCMRCLVSSSAWLEPLVKERVARVLDCEFHEIYGTSEVASPTNIRFGENPDKDGSVGRCVEGARIRIRLEDGSEAEIGQVGEISTASEQHFNGYYKRPEMTAAAYDGEFFRTGDLGYVDEDGYLYYAGRLKEVIVTGGINVYPQDIEAMLLNEPGVGECAAFACYDENLGEVVGVIVAPKGDIELTERQIAVACARKLADFQQPRKVLIVDKIPKNEMGKISRVSLGKQFGGMR